MSSFSFGLMTLTLGLVLTGTSCTQVQPAGSLGYMMDGETRLRPTPNNFLHVPPRDQDRTPTPMQWGMNF
jgi:hypothetical protein